MNDARKGDWIQTFTGKQYWPIDPRVEDVCIEDIAHALSLMCRFGGHCKRFYSVAEHSVLVSQCVPDEHRLQALLHDAAEAYCVDIPRPLKRFLQGYAAIEDRNWIVISAVFHVPYALYSTVKEADTTVLYAEAKQIMSIPVNPWKLENIPAACVDVIGLTPTAAKALFLDRFKELV